uniref:Uncharacterized protein n=1 Tax=Trichuris muris TaxID=70415 RepID=A0A5S6QZL8_TRIMR
MHRFVFCLPPFTCFPAYLCVCIIVVFLPNLYALSDNAPEKVPIDVSAKKDAAIGRNENVAAFVKPGNDSLQLLSVVKLNETTVVGKLRTTVIEWMKKPYVHGIVFPAVVGIACAFVVVVSLLSVRACVKSQARKRRRRRIRNLADELKTDKTMLLAAESSDEDF